jgi:hypothetical protein
LNLAVLIKGNENESVLHELLVAHHSVHKVLQVLLGVGDVGVVGIVCQSRSVEHVLGSILAFGNISSEVLLSIDNILATSSALADVVKGHEWVVLARFYYQ